MVFKDRLKELRKAKGLSQVALANRLGLSKSTIGMYETGNITPSLDALNMIADYFNVDTLSTTMNIYTHVFKEASESSKGIAQVIDSFNSRLP